MLYRLSAIIVLLFCHSVAHAEPMPPMEWLDLTLTIGDAKYKIVEGSQFYEEAKKLCQDSEDRLAKYDRTPSQNASVLHCFADVEAGGKHIKEACGLYDRALRDYKMALTEEKSGLSAALTRQEVNEATQKITANYKGLGCPTGRYDVPIQEKSRARLEGINGVAFGSTLTQARAKFGRSAKVVPAKRRGRTVKMLLVHNAQLWNSTFTIGYAFATDNRMTSLDIQSDRAIDQSACAETNRKVLTSIKQEFGQPDSERGDFVPRGEFFKSFGGDFEFKFKDGNVLNGVYNWSQNYSSSPPYKCYIWIRAYSPQGKED